MKKSNFKKVSIEELANGKLPEHLYKSIGDVKLTLKEVSEWRKTQPQFYVAIREGHLVVDVRVRWSLKKILAVLGATFGLIWALIKFSIEAWPVIEKWLT